MLLLLSCALNAWGQQMYFSMQVRKPAAIRVSPEAHSALVLNSMQLTDPVRSCLFAMTQTLEEQERFDEVAVLPLSNGAASKTVASTKSAVEVVVKRALSVSQADSLCDLYGVDVLLVIVCGSFQLSIVKRIVFGETLPSLSFEDIAAMLTVEVGLEVRAMVNVAASCD